MSPSGLCPVRAPEAASDAVLDCVWVQGGGGEGAQDLDPVTANCGEAVPAPVGAGVGPEDCD